MKREEVCALIKEIGILPSVRVASQDLAFFAAETVYAAGIPIVEITLTVPGARIAESQHEDLKRNLEFTLRAAFVNTLQEKAILELAKADLEYYDKIIEISRDRFKAGDIAQVDFDRNRRQTEAQLNLWWQRKAKVQYARDAKAQPNA